jgi:predicted small metal-binding protein
MRKLLLCFHEVAASSCDPLLKRIVQHAVSRNHIFQVTNEQNSGTRKDDK